MDEEEGAVPNSPLDLVGLEVCPLTVGRSSVPPIAMWWASRPCVLFLTVRYRLGRPSTWGMGIGDSPKASIWTLPALGAQGHADFDVTQAGAKCYLATHD